MTKEDIFSDEEQAPSFVDNAEIVTKYKTAGSIAERALAKVIEACKDGATILDLVNLGDATIEELCKGVYNKKDKDGRPVPKGIAFPTTVSPNNCVCHMSPLASDAPKPVSTGDVLKVELGVHIDGFISQVGTTVVVGASKDKPITGRAADAIAAAQCAAEVALRTLKPGRTNLEVADMVQKATEQFGCKPIEGMMSYLVEQNVLDGDKHIVFNPPENQKVEEVTFEEGEAYTVDIRVSTGEGKYRAAEDRTSIFKRVPDAMYQLKMKASRTTLNEISKKHNDMAFTLRSLDDEKKARMGMVECMTHQLVIPYPVLYEKADDAVVASVQYTVLLMPTGPLKVTNFPYDASIVKTDKSVTDDEVKKVLHTAVRSSGKSKKKKKKTAAADGAAPAKVAA